MGGEKIIFAGSRKMCQQFLQSENRSAHYPSAGVRFFRKTSNWKKTTMKTWKSAAVAGMYSKPTWLDASP
jgi:hypothetical protein